MENTKKETVVTMDGETVAVEGALCLNYGRVLSCLLSVKHDPKRKELGGRLQKLLEALKQNPGQFAVSHPTTATARQLNEALFPIRVRESAPELWIPYTTALENWKKHQPNKAPAAPAPNSALEAAQRYAERAAERVRKQTEKNREQVAALDAFIPQSVKNTEKSKQQKCVKSNAECDDLVQLMTPFIQGKGYVNSDRYPSKIQMDSEETGDWEIIAFREFNLFDEIAGKAEDDGTELEKTKLPCAFCKEEHMLSATEKVPVSKNGKKEIEERFILRQIFLPVLNETGSEPYKSKNGQVKKLAAVCCRKCASLAFGITKELDKKDPKKIWPTDLLPKVLEYKTVQKEENRLRANLAERTNAK